MGHTAPNSGYYRVVARIVKTKDVCDVCQNPRRKVKTYRVGQDGDLVKVELCREDAEPLERLLKIGERIPFASRRAKLWTPEEIERERRRQAQNAKNQPRT